MARLSFDGVTKEFQDGDDVVVAVNQLDLEIQDGEFLVLVGPSGCGKSTTLRMVAGLETPTRGGIRLGDRVINNLRPQNRDIAMVFQSYALYPHMSVRENMSFGLQQSTDMTDAEIDTEVTETSQMLNISELLDRLPGELSGGQQQRVALGRAIVRDPEVFLMDEPLSNLDAKLRAQMRTELQKIQEELDVTTIYVTHDQTEAMTMGDRIAILNEGDLQQAGTPIECYHTPSNLFVAGFLGEPSMNFYEGTLTDGTLETEYFDYAFSQETQADLGQTTDLTLGIRPEDIEVRRDISGDHVYPATVGVVEPQGNENTVHLRFEDQDELDEDTLTATVDGMRSFETGDDVFIRIPEDAIHVFDTRSGEALHNRNFEGDLANEASDLGTA